MFCPDSVLQQHLHSPQPLFLLAWLVLGWCFLTNAVFTCLPLPLGIFASYCVMCHVSRVTCHLSPFTFHLSPVPCQIKQKAEPPPRPIIKCHASWCLVSHVMYHMSCVMCHLSCVTCHVSRVTNHLSHVKKNLNFFFIKKN